MAQIDMHSTLKRAPGLTGIRAAAVLLVMVYHLGVPIHGGFIGVNVFFVLSGFLITHLLLDETSRRGRISFGNFYTRRALRLYPALIALVGCISMYSLLAPGALRAQDSLNSIPAVVLYFANWIRAFPEGNASLGLYEHTWSLSIEEQFYLLWPVFVWATIHFCKNLWAVGLVATLGILSSIVVRLVTTTSDGGLSRISNGTDTQADQLLMGALLAVLVVASDTGQWRDKLRTVLTFAFVPAVMLLFCAAVFWPHHGDSIPLRLTLSIVAIAAAVIVGHIYLAPSNRTNRLMTSRLALYVGDRSYGLYLWHYPIFTIVLTTDVGGPARLALMGIAFIISFAFAEASYRYVERPFLRFKDRQGKNENQRRLSASPDLS